MLAERVALLAARLGIQLPRVAGQTRLGLAGTIRLTAPIPLRFHDKSLANLDTVDPGQSPAELIGALNRTNVWAWAEAKVAVGPEVRWRGPDTADEARTLERAADGTLPERDFSVVLATARLTLRCVPAQEGGLLIIGIGGPRRAPFARLLVAQFKGQADASFDVRGFCHIVASQGRARMLVNERELLREEAAERDFISAARRYLENLQEYERASTPRAEYEITSTSPLRVARQDGEAWPRTFTRAGTQVQIPATGGGLRTFRLEDVSDDGDMLTFAVEVEENELEPRGELRRRPGDDPLRRMREALDAIAMGADEAYGRLLAAMTRPESLPDLQVPEAAAGDEQSARQRQTTVLALSTPDIALIHGPPGTGKTTVICDIVQQLVAIGLRVLLVAPTHVALDNVLERVGDRPGVTAIRLGTLDNVEGPARRYVLENRSRDLGERLATSLSDSLSGAPPNDDVVAIQREWLQRVQDDREVGSLLLLNANLVCATPIGLAMTREFRDVETVFDVMIMDESSKATITDFLVPASRARKWILVGDHMQLSPYVDVDELEAVIVARVRHIEVEAPHEDWPRGMATALRNQFEARMHPNPGRRARSWSDFVECLVALVTVDDESFDHLVQLGANAPRWRALHAEIQKAVASPAPADLPLPRDLCGSLAARVVRLGAELLEMQGLALRSVFEHLTRLPRTRTVRLNYQHRMAPALAAFSARMVYENDYPSAPSTHGLGLPIPSLEAPSIWIDTSLAPSHRRYEHPRDRDWRGGDYTNRLELDVTMEVVETCAEWAVQSWRGDVRKHGEGARAPFEIGVVCFYLKQALQLREALFRRLAEGTEPWRRHFPKPAANQAPIDVHVSIVDRFQGREKDVVILCTTRSNPVGVRGHIDNLNRLNVAVTRARHKRIVIGDAVTLAGKEPGRKRPPDDLLRTLYEESENKPKWGRVLGQVRS
jgi:hypothetical protein